MQFTQKVALVCREPYLLSEAACRAFAGSGMTVISINNHCSDKGCIPPPDQDEIEAIFVDNSDAGAFDAAVNDIIARHGRIDVFFGSYDSHDATLPITDYPMSEFDDEIDRCVDGMFSWMRYVLPVMVEQGRGTFIVNCSIAALNGLSQRPTRSAADHALLGLVRSAALAVAPDGVTVNALCHGLSLDEKDSSVVTETGQAPATDFGLTSPTDVADMALFLCSDSAKSVTGAHFVIDGAQNASLN